MGSSFDELRRSRAPPSATAVQGVVDPLEQLGDVNLPVIARIEAVARRSVAQGHVHPEQQLVDTDPAIAVAVADAPALCRTFGRCLPGTELVPDVTAALGIKCADARFAGRNVASGRLIRRAAGAFRRARATAAAIVWVGRLVGAPLVPHAGTTLGIHAAHTGFTGGIPATRPLMGGATVRPTPIRALKRIDRTLGAGRVPPIGAAHRVDRADAIQAVAIAAPWLLARDTAIGGCAAAAPGASGCGFLRAAIVPRVVAAGAVQKAAHAIDAQRPVATRRIMRGAAVT